MTNWRENETAWEVWCPVCGWVGVYWTTYYCHLSRYESKDLGGIYYKKLHLHGDNVRFRLVDAKTGEVK